MAFELGIPIGPFGAHVPVNGFKMCARNICDFAVSGDKMPGVKENIYCS